MHLVVLPGLDGGAALSRSFRQRLPSALTSEVVEYPPTELLGYDALERRVRDRLGGMPGPKVILGESFSGPIAIRLAKIVADFILDLPR